METRDQPEISSDGKDFSVEEILERYNWYIALLAWQIVLRNSKIAYLEVLDLLVDEVSQNSRIKLWLALKGATVRNPRLLIRHIVHNEFISLVRQHKSVLPLPIDEDGELMQGKLLVTQDEEDDPERILEREMTIIELLDFAAVGVSTMGPCQWLVMVCSIKDAVENVPQLVAIFRTHGLEIEEVEWPDEKSEVVRLKTSLSAARLKMRSMRKEQVCA